MLDEKYEDVLKKYQLELDEMRTLFEKNRENPPISKNMPEKAGKIAWARSIMGRIKAPIEKFKTKSDKLNPDTFMKVATEYVRLAKDLDQHYEKVIFDKWQKENTEQAVQYLKQPILESKKKGADQTEYFVNFAPELRVTIREAKFLDRIGKVISPTITNIALQEKDYMRYIDKLQ
jgi:dynein heavy chain